MRNAMILCAGRGERMRPLTDQTPKALLCVKGKPLIAWHLERLRRAGFENVVINLAHLGDQIRAHVGDASAWGLSVRYSEEPPGALETAGGIRQAEPWRHHAKDSAKEPFLVINGDVFTDWPAETAAALARDLAQHRALCHLVMVDNPGHHAQGDFDLPESPGWLSTKGPAHRLTFSGIGVYDPAMFTDITAGSRVALGPLLQKAIGQTQCRATHYRGLWADVGTPDRLARLNEE